MTLLSYICPRLSAIHVYLRPWWRSLTLSSAVSIAIQINVEVEVSRLSIQCILLTYQSVTLLRSFCNFTEPSNLHTKYAVLGVKISHGHDHTSCATLGHFEVEFRCGTCSYDTRAQCWVQRFIVGAAHFDVTVLKRRPPREGGTPKRLKIWLFQGANVDERHWNFHGTIPTPWPITSTRLHSPDPPALCATMQNPIVRAKGC